MVSLVPPDPLEFLETLDPLDHQALLADPETVVNLYVAELSCSIFNVIAAFSDQFNAFTLTFDFTYADFA